jgi:hypothetical protein
MKKKFNPALLAEEIKRVKMINEYTFYTGPDSIEEDDTEAPADDLTPVDANAATDAIGSELGVDDSQTNSGDTATASGSTGDAGAIPPPDAGADAGAMPPPAPMDDAPLPQSDASETEPSDDSVEVDVTSLVDGSKEAKHSADLASKNSVNLLAKFDDLENRVAKMGSMSDKIEQLEKELVRRNPTPVEKLEMQSLHSFPYSVKLSDYWNEKTKANDVDSDNPEVYEVSQDELDATYNEQDVKKSFDIDDAYNEEEF